MGSVIKVGIADLNVAKAPDSLISYALGSCVGICLYDPVTKVAGMSHILLPEKPDNDNNIMKYADSAIPYLMNELMKKNVMRSRVVAKIAGGANMFGGVFKGNNAQIGERNVKSTRDALKKLGIPIIAEDVGGSQGRTIEFTSDDGMLRIRSLPSKDFKI
jgi:chemotaxis protein CheD